MIITNFIETSSFIILFSVGLSRNEVIDELLLFLVAGSETTGATLAWFIYFMSKYSRVQTKLKAELGDNKHNRMTIEQIESLTYLDCVIQEVFHFLPPGAGTTRAVTMDDRLPGTGVQLHKGDEIFIPFYNLGRDKRCWKIDPDLFYPERFQGEDKDHHVYALIPFGGGHRQCIGQDLARFELKSIIVRLMQHVTFGDGGDKVNAGGYVQRIITIPKNIGVTITFD
jgi:cytochrome P450